MCQLYAGRRSYPGRPGAADGCVIAARVRVHGLVDGFAGSLVGQSQLVSLTIEVTKMMKNKL